MSIRNYDSTQRNYRKNLSSKLARKSNLKIINIFGREILNSGSGRKKLSKTHRPKTGVAAPWELRYNLYHIKNIYQQNFCYLGQVSLGRFYFLFLPSINDSEK